MAAAGSPCQMPEAYNAFVRCGRPAVDIIFGELHDDERVKRRVREWCSAANARNAFKGAIFGYLGHCCEGMLDMNFDPTTVTRAFGAHVRMLEMCELVSCIENVSRPELDQKLQQIRETFDILEQSSDPTTKPVEEEDLVWAAKVSVGLDKLVFGNGFSGLAYYYMGENNSIYERAASNLTVGNSLLMADGIVMAGEGDMKTCLAMHLTSALGHGGSFAELCSVDFDADIVIVGHDGPHDMRVGNRKPRIRGLNQIHGRKGDGLTVEFSTRHGDMTMVGIGSDDTGSFRMIVAEGESRAGWVPPIGSTLTRAYFGPNVAGFVEDWCKAGACHHMSLCAGHCGDVVAKLGKLTGIEVMRVR
jgi:L-arabinose isomerase